MSRQWSFYNPDTGLFVDLLHSGPPGSEIDAAPAGCLPIEGHHDWLCKRVVDGVVVDYQPPQPSKHHEWNGSRWELTAEARQAQATIAKAESLLAIIDARRSRPLSDFALGIPGAAEKLAALEVERTECAAALVAARAFLA